uniref:Uncharacterized protein n=1 Tax=Cacopsylla melanoneura TaxID=428564 RepID=A0A8D8VA76_9HEMI
MKLCIIKFDVLLIRSEGPIACTKWLVRRCIGSSKTCIVWFTSSKWFTTRFLGAKVFGFWLVTFIHIWFCTNKSSLLSLNQFFLNSFESLSERCFVFFCRIQL